MLEAMEKPGCTNNQTRLAACYLSSFLLSNGEALNSLLRGLVVGLRCRSVLLDDRGMAISLDSDPHSTEY